jgi:hypothetical protein
MLCFRRHEVHLSVLRAVHPTCSDLRELRNTCIALVDR